jgi:ribosomal protein L21E
MEKSPALPNNTRKNQAINMRKNQTIATQRTLAKAGMGASMGVLVWSAMVRGRKAMRYHTLAGVALLGFTVWHIALYKARNKIFEE